MLTYKLTSPYSHAIAKYKRLFHGLFFLLIKVDFPVLGFLVSYRFPARSLSLTVQRIRLQLHPLRVLLQGALTNDPKPGGD